MTITHGRPDGYTTLTPFLVCSPAAEAITFYEEVFGATVVGRMDGPDGTVMHAELDLGDGRLQLSDPNEQYGLVPPTRDGDTVSGSTVLRPGRRPLNAVNPPGRNFADVTRPAPVRSTVKRRVTTPCTRTAGIAKPNRGSLPDSTVTFTLG